MLFATSSFFLRFHILFTVKYPLISEKMSAPETRTPINFSNRDIPDLVDANDKEIKKEVNNNLSKRFVDFHKY